jgi:hypothetical protein
MRTKLRYRLPRCLYGFIGDCLCGVLFSVAQSEGSLAQSRRLTAEPPRRTAPLLPIMSTMLRVATHVKRQVQRVTPSTLRVAALRSHTSDAVPNIGSRWNARSTSTLVRSSPHTATLLPRPARTTAHASSSVGVSLLHTATAARASQSSSDQRGGSDRQQPRRKKGSVRRVAETLGLTIVLLAGYEVWQVRNEETYTWQVRAALCRTTATHRDRSACGLCAIKG